MLTTAELPNPFLPRQFGPAASMALLTGTLITFLAASSAPTPLYAIYRDTWGFSPITLTLVFAVYAFSLLLALLTVGSLSDHIGRRKVLLGALALEAVAMVMFLAADSVATLIAARIVQGLATGAATSALGAALLDFHRARGSLVNSVAPTVGMAVGALGASILVQFAPWPMHLVFVVLLLVFIAQGAASFFLPETVSPQPGALASLRPSIRVPVQARRALLAAAPVAIAVWALGGFYLALGPTLARTVTGYQAPVTGGLLVFALTISGAVAIMLFRNSQARSTMTIGALVLIAGLSMTLAGVHGGGVFLFFFGSIVAGVGFGSAFLGALRTVLPLAEAHERAGLMAAFYVMCYLAMSVPAVAAGAAVGSIGLIATTDCYGIAVIALASIALLGDYTSRLAGRRVLA